MELALFGNGVKLKESNYINKNTTEAKRNRAGSIVICHNIEMDKYILGLSRMPSKLKNTQIVIETPTTTKLNLRL